MPKSKKQRKEYKNARMEDQYHDLVAASAEKCKRTFKAQLELAIIAGLPLVETAAGTIRQPQATGAVAENQQ